MERLCAACGVALTGRQRAWCSGACRERARYNHRQGMPLDRYVWRASSTCSWCGQDTSQRGAAAKFCSSRCKLDHNHAKQLERHHAAKRATGIPIPGDLVPCANAHCNQQAIYKQVRAWCSDKCKNYVAYYKYRNGTEPSKDDGWSTPVYFKPCPDCATLVAAKVSTGHKVCRSCRKIRNRAANAIKNHRRRTAGPKTMSVDDLAARDGARCNLCNRKVDMNLSGHAKWGPTIDHLVPVSHGGTNDPSNLALAHNFCNVSRHSRGPVQLLLAC